MPIREFVIDGRAINDSGPAYVVAEIGHNHGGDLKRALDLIRTAAHCGASAVKFQKRANATLYTVARLAAPYENENSYGPTYGAHRAALEFDDPAQWRELAACATAAGVAWFSTAFDETSADFLAALDVPVFKIHSGGLTDRALLAYVATLGKPVIISTGGGSYSDIARAVETLGDCPHAILHCTAAYPLQPIEANLNVIPELRRRYPDTVIGWSSHSPGIALSLVAYTLGARIIEHHFTGNRAWKGTDHAFSLEPKGLQTLTEDLEKTRLALGDGVKRTYASELGPLAKMHRIQTPEGLRITG